MSKPTVIVEVDRAGEVTVEVDGMKGKGCEKIVSDLTLAITGKEADHKENKPEYHQTPDRQAPTRKV